MVLVLTLGAVLLLDQFTKVLVRNSMQPAESIPLIQDIFHITYVRNTGAAFGLMPGQQGLFIFTTILVLSGIGLYWWRVRPRSLLLALALGMVAGGAVGNVIDRVVAGRVTDFFDVLSFPVFNVADIGIVVGAAALFIWAAFAPAHELPGVPDASGPTGTDRLSGHADEMAEQPPFTPSDSGE